MSKTKTTAPKARKTTAPKARKTPPVKFSLAEAVQITRDGLRAAGRMENAQVARDNAALAFGDMLKVQVLTTDGFRRATKDGSRPEGIHCAVFREEVAMTWLTAKERRVIAFANDKSAGSPYHKAMNKVNNAVDRFLDHVDRMAKKGNGNGNGRGGNTKPLPEYLKDMKEAVAKRIRSDAKRTDADHSGIEKAMDTAFDAVLAELAKA